MVWDSGDFMATYTADEQNGFAAFFNSEGSECRPTALFCMDFGRSIQHLVVVSGANRVSHACGRLP